MTTAPFAGTQNSAYGTLQLLTLHPIRPESLSARARIGVAALSGVVDPAALAAGIASLEGAGLDVRRAANLERREGLFAGTDDERLAGLHELAADPSIEAILFARGGHGVLRLLPRVDWELLARRPRWYVGYSDLTPFLAQVVGRLGWLALHGPMVAADPPLDRRELEGLFQALRAESIPAVPVAGSDGDWGGVSAPLMGGCLSMLAATAGTEWAMPTAGAVLFLEDVHEPLYRVDRMLQQLSLAGSFDGVRGIVLGSFETPEGEPHDPSALLASVRDAAGGAAPIAWGCPSGHCRPNATLTLGAPVRLDPDRGRLEFAGG